MASIYALRRMNFLGISRQFRSIRIGSTHFCTSAAAAAESSSTESSAESAQALETASQLQRRREIILSKLKGNFRLRSVRWGDRRLWGGRHGQGSRATVEFHIGVNNNTLWRSKILESKSNFNGYKTGDMAALNWDKIVITLEAQGYQTTGMRVRMLDLGCDLTHNNNTWEQFEIELLSKDEQDIIGLRNIGHGRYINGEENGNVGGIHKNSDGTIPISAQWYLDY